MAIQRFVMNRGKLPLSWRRLYEQAYEIGWESTAKLLGSCREKDIAGSASLYIIHSVEMLTE